MYDYYGHPTANDAATLWHKGADSNDNTNMSRVGDQEDQKEIYRGNKFPPYPPSSP
jgi:hypothetical protein